MTYSGVKIIFKTYDELFPAVNFVLNVCHKCGYIRPFQTIIPTPDECSRCHKTRTKNIIVDHPSGIITEEVYETFFMKNYLEKLLHIVIDDLSLDEDVFVRNFYSKKAVKFLIRNIDYNDIDYW